MLLIMQAGELTDLDCVLSGGIVSVFLQVFLAKLLNHMLPSLSLGSIESKWVSRDKTMVMGVFACLCVELHCCL